MRIPSAAPAPAPPAASFVALALVLAVAGCVSAPRGAPPVPAPAAVVQRPLPSAPSLAADWRDWPATAGDWRYRPDASGSSAIYADTTAGRILTLRCDRVARRIVLSRVGALATPFTVRTSSAVRVLPVAPLVPNTVATSLAASDPLLDAIGFSRGRFVVEQPGTPPLVLPAWAEIERVTEDCRG